MEDAQDLAEKYRLELETVNDKYQKINEYIHGSRTNTIKHDASNAKFVAETIVETDEINETRNIQTTMNYSALEVDITELKDELKNQKQFS